MKDKLSRLAGASIIGGFLAVQSTLGVRIILLAFFVLLLARLWFLWKPQDFFGRYSQPQVLLLVCSLIVGFLYGMTGDKYISPAQSIKEIEIEGKLSDWVEDEMGARGVIIVINVINTAESAALEAAGVKGTAERTRPGIGKKYTVFVYPGRTGGFAQGWDRVQPGDLLRLTGSLEHPKPPGTKGEFDVPLYNAVRGISGTITARGEALILKKGKPGISWRIRQYVRKVLDRHWPAEAAILEGILFGDSSRIPTATLDKYKAAGVMHVFAASGANVAFVLALAWGIFIFLPRRLRIIASMVIIILYAALCQGNPPILRATILGIAVLLGMLGKGKLSSLRWLLFAALILFAVNPLFLRDTSFQLSFAATWGIIVISPRLNKLSWMRKLPQGLRLAIAVSLGAQLAALPVLVSVFNRISLAGFLTNVFMLFILGAVLQIGLLGTALILFPVLPLAFFQVAFWLLKLSDAILTAIASFPLAYFWVLNPGKFFWILWYLALGVLLLGKERIWFIVRVQLRKLVRFVDHIRNCLAARKGLTGCAKIEDLIIADSRQDGINSQSKMLTSYRKKLLRFLGGWISFGLGRKNRLCFIVIVMMLLLWGSSWKQESLEVTFLDVGQGDCILIETPCERLLVDAGPRSAGFDAGERIVVPYLVEKRIGYLDMVFITHEDIDHLGGIKYVLSNIPAGGVAVPEVGERLYNADWQEGLPADLLNFPAKLIRLKAGDRLEYASGLSIEVLAPVAVLTGTTADANNNSLVLFMEYLGYKVMLTGDMEKEEIRQIAERGGSWEADFLKVPHHGSKGALDSSWFDRTSPKAVFIQVGRNNFGHPAPEVINYWQERGIPIFRTDIHGTIRLLIDRQGFNILPGRNQISCSPEFLFENKMCYNLTIKKDKKRSQR